MFKKLLSNLPFNPSLIGEVAFYARRMQQEAALRRLGLILLSLAMAVQALGVVRPPQSSLASSNSDLITGGFSTQQEAVDHCRQNTKNYGDILGHFGITCENIAQATTVSVSPVDYNRGLYIMGRLAYGVAGETPVTVPDVGTLYLRHFYSLMKAPSYKALKGSDINGSTFYILYICGNPVFIGVAAPAERCEYDSSLYAQDSACFEPCPIAGKSSIAKSSADCFEPCPFNKDIAANDAACFEPCPIAGKSSIAKSSAQCFKPCEFDPSISNTSPACKPCEEAEANDNIIACIKFQKSASNTTQSIDDANNSTAQPNDVIEYTLTTTNTSKIAVNDYVVNENISDLLDYAIIKETNGGAVNGESILSWPAQILPAEGSIQAKFSVIIKDPIPNTPISASDPGHFDMKMTNVYGNAVVINLPPTIVKTTEILTTQTLPNTGPGTSLVLGLMAVTISATLFARNRLFVEELEIVKHDYTRGGGR